MDGVALWPDEAFRGEAPEAGPAPALRVPTVERFTLSNGLEVFFVAEPSLPIARAWLDFDLGAIDDPRKKAGMADLCFDLLDEGTKSLDKVAFAAKLDDHGLRMSSGAGLEGPNVSLASLVSEFDEGLDMMRELLTAPGLRSDDFTRLQERKIEGLAQQKATHVGVSRRLLASRVYGPDHPYGAIVTERSLRSISAGDCAKLMRRLGPKGARLFVSAKMDRAQLEEKLEAGLGKWKGRAPAHRKVAPAKLPAGKLYFVDMPGSAQSSVSIAAMGPGRTASDYPATSIMTRILGGSFSSRLNMNLREDKGFAYGARGGFRYRREGSYLSAGARVRADATVQSVREVLKEIANLREGSVSEAELTRERDGAIAALPGAFGQASQTLATFRQLAFYGLPMDWYQGYAKALEGLDAEQVEGAAREHLPVDEYVVLVVGDGAVVREELEALAADKQLELVELDADGAQLR